MTVRTPPWGTVTTGLGRLIRREIKARSETLVGTVIGRLRILDDDGAGSATWVCDVDVGGLEALMNAPVKMGSGGSRFYAALGQTVRLQRNTQGRFDVVGPGDRVGSVRVKTTYARGTLAQVNTENQGRFSETVAYSFYQGPTPGVPGSSRWNDGVTPYPLTRIVDANGNPV